MKKLFGVITAMTTPFDENGKVNVKALEEQTDYLIDSGIHCLYPCGTTGEMYYMSVEERELVAETVVKRAAGRVTVFIHTGAMTQEDTIRLTQHAHRIGADGVGVVTPSYFGLNERAMVEYYKAVSSSVPSDFSVYVYVIPQLAANDITAATMEKIAAACPNVVGVKYSFADMRRINEYLLVKGGNFSVVPGPDDLFLPVLSVGCDGVVSGCSNAFPKEFIAVWDAYQRGDIEGARKAQIKATFLAKTMKGGADMSIFKNILKFRGLYGGYMKKPLQDLTDEQVKELYEKVKAYL